MDKKEYEEETQSQDSTTHSDLIPFTESQSARQSYADSSHFTPSRETLMSFGSISNPASSRKPAPSSELASFAGSSRAHSSIESQQADNRPSFPQRNAQEEDFEQAPQSPVPVEHAEVRNPQEEQSPVVSPQGPPPPRTSNFTSVNFDLSQGSSIQSPQEEVQVPKSKARPAIRIEAGQDQSERAAWSKVCRPPDDSTGRKRRKPNAAGEDPVSLFDDEGVYKISHFIPRCSMVPAHIVDERIVQHFAVNLPNLKIAVIRLVPGQRLDDFINPDGDTTGHILRCQKQKLLVRIHSNQHIFSQGDYFYVPRGNTLSLQNTSERMAAILQLVVTKVCD